MAASGNPAPQRCSVYTIHKNWKAKEHGNYSNNSVIPFFLPSLVGASPEKGVVKEIAQEASTSITTAVLIKKTLEWVSKQIMMHWVPLWRHPYLRGEEGILQTSWCLLAYRPRLYLHR